MAKDRSFTQMATKPVELEKPKDILPTCLSCKFFRKSEGAEYGECRRYPPSVYDPSRLTIHGPKLRFAIVTIDNLCGEFSTK